MVDIVLLQSLSYVAAAIGVCVAAVYYVMNLRVQQENMWETTKNRKIAYTTDFMKAFYSKEFGRRYIDLVRMDWKDHDDFMAKYDSRVNLENFADRWSFLGMLDVLGFQVKAGLVDLETIYELNWAPVLMIWMKFRPIIEEYKKTDYGSDQYANLEYLAREMWRIKVKQDPDWKEHGGGGFTREEYEVAFSK
jgi:hypothetical protein